MKIALMLYFSPFLKILDNHPCISYLCETLIFLSLALIDLNFRWMLFEMCQGFEKCFKWFFNLCVLTVFQTWTSAQTGPTSAATTLTVTTPWAHIVAPAKRDSLEMDSYAQVRRLTDVWLCISTCMLFFVTLYLWSRLQTATSAQTTATCVRAATVWTCRGATAVNVTWASSLRLMARPVRVRHGLSVFLSVLA